MFQLVKTYSNLRQIEAQTLKSFNRLQMNQLPIAITTRLVSITKKESGIWAPSPLGSLCRVRQFQLISTILMLKSKMRSIRLFQVQEPTLFLHNSNQVQRIMKRQLPMATLVTFNILVAEFMSIIILIDSASKSCLENQEILFQAQDNIMSHQEQIQTIQSLPKVGSSRNSLVWIHLLLLALVNRVQLSITLHQSLRKSLSFLMQLKSGPIDINSHQILK